MKTTRKVFSAIGLLCLAVVYLAIFSVCFFVVFNVWAYRNEPLAVSVFMTFIFSLLLLVLMVLFFRRIKWRAGWRRLGF